jgi:hypothetical protein
VSWWRRSSRRRKLVFGAVLGVALIAGGVVAAIASGLLLRDTATPVSIQEVLQRFHEGERASGELDGVYLYATRGAESVDALGGARHRYPAKTTITALTVPCGVSLQWEALEARSSTWTLCATRRGIELQTWDLVHRFFGQTDRTGYACGGTVLVPAQRAAGGPTAFRCRSDSGRQAGEARVVGIEQVAVAGARLKAVHVRTVARVTGGDSGTETFDWWLDERTGLPLRIAFASRTSRPFLIGDVHYREEAELRLLSTTPLR